MVRSTEYGSRATITGYLDSFRSMVENLDLDAIERVVNCLRQARDVGASIFVAGNGGSAATASHWVNDLGKATKRSGHRPLKVASLCENVAWISALGNDEGFERVFAGQLENLGEAGDVLVLISASGNSPNLLRATELAQARAMGTIALLGFDGGALLHMVDHPVLVASEIGAYGLVETAHSLVADIVTSCLIEDRAQH